MQYLKKIVFSACLLCFFAAVSLAQSGDAIITVIIKDQFDGVISDAEIKLIKPEEKEKIYKTNQQGIAQLPRITVGEYEIVVTAPGFKDYKSDKFRLIGGEKKRIEVVLEVAPVESNVEITNDEQVDPERSGMTTVLNEKDIDKLPDDPEELARVLKRIGESVAGEELPVSVNGIQGAKVPPKQAIQQIRINQNVFSAQYDSPFGGGIDIFTRANVKKYTGYLSMTFADGRFNASDPFLGRRLPYQQKSYFTNISGPLGKRANFMVWGSHSGVDSSAVVNAVTLNSNLQPVEFKQSFATPNRSESLYTNINADPTKKHKLYLSYNIFMNRGEGQNVGGFSLPSRATKSRSQGHYLQMSDTYLANENIVNQTRLLASYSANKNFGGSNDVALNVLDAFFGGGAQQDFSTKNLRVDTANETTWQMGRYALGFGFRVRGEFINQVSRSNFGGTYTFSGRFAPVLDANNNPVLDSSGAIVREQISSLESYRRTLAFQRLGYSAARIRELGGGANQFTISGGNPSISLSQYDIAGYVQNSYKISETLAVSGGLRYENQTNLSSDFNFAPRIGFIWAPKAKEKANPLYTLPRVSLGYGMFYTRFPLNSTLNVRQANGDDRLQYLITETNILDIYPTVPSVGLLNQFALPRTRRFLGEELDTPYASQFNLTVGKKLPKGYSLNFTASRNQTYRSAFTTNINAPLAGTFNPLNPAAAIRPFGNSGNIYETDSIGRSRSMRYSLSLGLPNSEKISGSLSYSFTKAKSNVVSGSGSPFDPYDFSQEFAPTPFDGVHTVGGYMSFSLPFGFSTFSDFSMSTGRRFNIFTGRDANGDGFFSERPAFATDMSKPNLVQTQYGVLDPNPAPGTPLIPRNLGRGPRNFNFNSYLSKTFKFGGDEAKKVPPKRTLSFNIRINNVFNVINKADPVGNMSSPNFLRSLSGFSDGGIYIINGAQQFNFAGRSMSFGMGFGF